MIFNKKNMIEKHKYKMLISKLVKIKNKRRRKIEHNFIIY